MGMGKDAAPAQAFLNKQSCRLGSLRPPQRHNLKVKLSGEFLPLKRRDKTEANGINNGKVN